jgi:hypothetical protein
MKEQLPSFKIWDRGLLQFCPSFASPLFVLPLLIEKVIAQAPVSDLTQYPSGLASVAVVCYYGVASDKDKLSHRRRVAGFGAENVFRDHGSGPRLRDTKLKGIVFSRSHGHHQHTSWGLRFVGKSSACLETGVAVVERDAILDRMRIAFTDLPDPVKNAMQTAPSSFGCDGHWLAAIAAFCQFMSDLNGGDEILQRCADSKEDPVQIRELYKSLRDFVSDKTNELEMPDISGRLDSELDTLYIRADTWEQGGRPVFINCGLFIKIIGYCTGYNYGQLMAGAHRHLPKIKWADTLYIKFLKQIDTRATVDEIATAMTDTLAACVFHERQCDLRVFGHRFGDFMASLVSGSLIAILVSLGSTCGTWVSVTAAAVADPKPVSGPTSAAWGYPIGRLSHMEAKSRPSAGLGAVCLKGPSRLTSFRPFIEQDIVSEIITGVISLLILLFKYPLRTALGFGQFAAPQEWVTFFGLAAAALGTLIGLQLPIWAYSHGGRFSFLHACIMSLVEITSFVLRILWRSRSSPYDVRSFWLADGTVWIHSFLGSWYSVHLNESTEYPVTGWLWPTTWLLAIASSGAGVPRRPPT